MNQNGRNESAPSRADDNSPYEYDYDESVFTGERSGTNIFRAADSFRDFASRFTVFEDAAGSELHLPDEPGAKCEGCGADASYAVYAVMRRTKLLESMPSMDRVGSDYRIFGLPLCGNCIPKEQQNEKRKGCIPALRGCLQVLLIYTLFAIGAMAVFYYGFGAFDIEHIEDIDPDLASRNMMYFIGLLVGWVIVYILLLNLVRFITGRVSRVDKGGERRYKAAIDKFINRLKLERYDFLYHTEPAPISVHLKIEDLVQQSYRLWGLTYLFRKHWRAGSKLQVFNRTVFELSSDDYNSWGARLSRDRVCCGCGKPASKSHRLIAHRGVGATLGAGVSGLAREYGIIDIPLCSECVVKDGGIVNARKPLTWIDYAKLGIPMLITLPLVMMVTSWIYDSHISGLTCMDIILKVLLIVIAAIAIFAFGIFIALVLIGKQETAWETKYTYKKVVDLEPVKRAIDSGWGIGAVPDETDLELSVNLKYWFDREGVDISKSA